MSEVARSEAVYPPGTMKYAGDSTRQSDARGAASKLAYDAELLRWLLRFPLQRIADLATMSGLSIPQAYARIRIYEREGLVAGLRIRGIDSPNAHMYYLTHAGLQRLAATFGPQVWSLAQAWGADDNALIRALPRVSTLMATQHFVLALLADAPARLGVNGHPARIEWAWDRDHREPCRVLTRGHSGHSGHSMQSRQTFRFDAYVRVQVRPASGSEARSYSFFVVYDTGFGDVRLLRRRLRTLLCCRDAFEDRQPAGTFPTLLILVPDAHRARLWQAYALRMASEDWLVHPLLGGICCAVHAQAYPPPTMSTPEGSRRSLGHNGGHTRDPWRDPWRTPWHALDRPGTCSLVDLFRSVPPGGTPLRIDRGERPPTDRVSAPRDSLCRPHEGARQCPPHLSIQKTALPVFKRTDNKAPYDNALREDWQRWRPSTVRRWMAWTSQQIEGRHYVVLQVLASHPLLWIADVAAVLGLEVDTASRYIAHLEHLGLACGDREPSHDEASSMGCGQRRPTGAAGTGYALTQLGIYLLAAQAGVPMRRHLSSSRVATSDVRGRAGSDPGLAYARDVASCRRIWEHTRGVYTFFALLHRAVRGAPHDAATSTPPGVCWWETGRACMRHYRVQHGWHAIRPDGAAEVVADGRRLMLWLEWDRSTMGLRDLRTKFTVYAEYVRSREWRTDGNTPLPLLLIVTADTDGETRVARALTDAMPSSTQLGIRIASASALRDHSPLGAIWRPWLPGTASSRLALGPPSMLIPVEY